MSEEVVQLGAETRFQGLMRLEGGREEGIWAPSWNLWEVLFQSAALNQLPWAEDAGCHWGPRQISFIILTPSSSVQQNFQVTSFQKVTEGSLMQTINPLRVSSLGGHDLRQWVTSDKNHKPHLWGAGQEAVQEDEKPAGGSTWCQNGRLAIPTNWTTKITPPARARFQPCCPRRQSSVKTIYKSWSSRRALKTLLCQST